MAKVSGKILSLSFDGVPFKALPGCAALDTLTQMKVSKALYALSPPSKTDTAEDETSVSFSSQ